jgi:hypothetical protein
MKTKFLFIGIICGLFLGCDNIQDTRPATSMTNTNVGSNPKIIAFTNPNCNPSVNTSYCSALLNFNLSFGGSSYQPDISMNGDEATFTYTNSNSDVVTIGIKPFVKGQSCNYVINSNSVLGNNRAYVNIYGNSIGSTKLNATANTDTLHVKYNSWNNSYNMVFCNSTFYYTFNFTSYSKSIEGRFDFIYP